MQKSWIGPAYAGLLLALAVAAPAAPPKKDAKKPPVKKETGGKYVTTKSGLKYTDLKVGTGPSPKVTDYVTVNYEGKLQNGKVFDASAKHGGPIGFFLNRVIAGWTEGVSTMKVGGKRKMIIPGKLAYGPNPPPESGIPANATLIFTVELVKIGQ